MKKLIEFVELINPECTGYPDYPIKVKAIKVDTPHKDSLKNYLKCSNMNTCDYIKKSKSNLYFIEISDLIWTLKYLHTDGMLSKKDALRTIKKELQLKFSQTLHLFEQMVRTYFIKKNKIQHKYALLCLCTEIEADIIVLSYIENTLYDVFVPSETYNDFKMIPFGKLDTMFTVS